MLLTSLLTDDVVLRELGVRLARVRLGRNLTQEQAAAEAGVSKTTVEKVERGRPVTLPSFLRILRALDLIDGLEQLVPPPPVSPVELMRLDGRERKRASGVREVRPPRRPGRFAWGDEGQGRDR